MNRNLEHSTILYEAGPVPPEARVSPSGKNFAEPAGTDILPLLRLSWNKQDPNYIATFQTDSTAVLIMDVRVPAIPVTELRGHGSVVTAIGWAPHSSSHICTAGTGGVPWSFNAAGSPAFHLANVPSAISSYG